ncbi:MAG: hypothetical protein ACLS69_07275 [Butyricicoccus sp.]
MNKLGEKSLKTLEYYEILKTGRTGGIQAAKENAARFVRWTTKAGRFGCADHGREGSMVRQGSPPRGIREVGAILSARTAAARSTA